MKGVSRLKLGKKAMRKFRVVWVSICFSLMLMGNACAYIDPSVMTYAIQVVAGLVVAVGAVAGVYLRKVKKKMQDKLGIDENSNKEVEEDIVILDVDE